MSLLSEGGSCPICGRPRFAKFKPFCSKRCADIDLAKWLRGEYSIPGAPLDECEKTTSDREEPEIH